MKMTNYGLVENCKKLAAANTVYMWGCSGQKLTDSLISAKAAQYPDRFSAARQIYLRLLASEKTYYACDCAGLIKNYLWGGFGGPLHYSAATDRGTESMKKASKISGKTVSLPEIPGVGVYKKNHIGVYIGGGRVIECTLGKRGDGVVVTPLRSGGWTEWFFIPGIKYPGYGAAKKKTVKSYAEKIMKFLKRTDIL
jgi:hypothetical protein